MINFHKQLLDISVEKTDYIKQSASDELVKIITKERQLITQVEQYEIKRAKLVDDFFKHKNIASDERTITHLLTYIDDVEKRDLLNENVQILLELIIQIKENEQLNTSLLQQSIQFVHLSLDMLQPESKNINYGNHAKRKESSINRSVFDSKV